MKYCLEEVRETVLLGVFLSDLCELKLLNIMLRLLIVFRLSANNYEIVSQHMSGWVVKTTCCIIDYMFEFVASGLSQHVFSSKSYTYSCSSLRHHLHRVPKHFL